jgi:hypothetical protein
MGSRIPLQKWQYSKPSPAPEITFLNNTLAGKTVPGKMKEGLMGKCEFRDLQPLFQWRNMMEGEYLEVLVTDGKILLK